MNTQTYSGNRAGNFQPRKAEPADKRRQYENRIESRANILASLVTLLSQSSYPNVQGDVDSADKDLETLLAKEAQLRWLVRVAKYSEGANREALWREAERKLEALEKAAEAKLHQECV
ncbi:MAG: hypothetical protein WB780_20560 [Candidatus Acidiferrales bacterium]